MPAAPYTITVRWFDKKAQETRTITATEQTINWAWAKARGDHIRQLRGPGVFALFGADVSNSEVVKLCYQYFANLGIVQHIAITAGRK